MGDNLLFRTIIGFEDDEFGIIPALMKIADIFYIRSLELIDRLIIVSYGEYIRTVEADRKDRPNQAHLCFIGILVFIDEDKLVLFCEICLDPCILFDKFDGSEDHIREINIPEFFQLFLIGFVDIRERLLFLEFSIFFPDSLVFIVFLSPSLFPRCEKLCTIVSFIAFPCGSESELYGFNK